MCIVFDEDEVESIKEFSMDELKTELLNNPQNFTPNLVEIFKIMGVFC